MDAHEPQGAETTQLAPGLIGRWEVRTRNSNHIWDLDQMTYMRQPLPTSTPMAYDNLEVRITRVDVWPSIGGCGLVWFDSPDDPLMEQWRISAKVCSIRRLAPSDECEETGTP